MRDEIKGYLEKKEELSLVPSRNSSKHESFFVRHAYFTCVNQAAKELKRAPSLEQAVGRNQRLSKLSPFGHESV